MPSISGAPGRRHTHETCVAMLTCSTTRPGHTARRLTVSSSACSCSTLAWPFSMPLLRTRSIQCFASLMPFFSARLRGTPSFSLSASAMRSCTSWIDGLRFARTSSMVSFSHLTASAMSANNLSSSRTATDTRRASLSTDSGWPRRMRSLLVCILCSRWDRASTRVISRFKPDNMPRSMSRSFSPRAIILASWLRRRRWPFVSLITGLPSSSFGMTYMDGSISESSDVSIWRSSVTLSSSNALASSASIVAVSAGRIALERLRDTVTMPLAASPP
mmetsp:Transcript_15964/g.55705  ORF Transcript_15964/g.55705 Transcript_15964/m.55705 type:complete len:275 (+) Transcript_15964:199-1023(+)